MILGQYSKDGTSIDLLKPYSRKLVMRQCDYCGDKAWTRYEHITTCRLRHQRSLDYCHKCGTSLATKGNKNASKRPEVRAKISKALRGKSKKFKDGKNPRIINRKKTVSGSIMVYDKKTKKYVHEHRQVMEKHLARKLYQHESVHHIDGNKTNNNINNLYLFADDSTHQLCHVQLQRLAMQLVEKGAISFDKSTGKYYTHPTLDISIARTSIGFDDVSIVQKKNICKSRLDVDISSEVIKGITRPIPLIAANMSTVTNADFCIHLNSFGALGVLHRAMPLDKMLSSIKQIALNCEIVCVSIGVDQSDIDLVRQYVSCGANVVFIDVAHGYSDTAISLCKKIKTKFPYIKIVLGNTINPDIILETYEFVDAIKVGIGQGLACETSLTAGCTEKQFSAVLRFKELSRQFEIPIISDGGIRKPSDFVKAIGAGANSVMAGSIFCACPESAGQEIIIDGKKKKLYAGMSSRFIQNAWKGGLKPGTCPEGKIVYLDVGENTESLLQRYSGAIKSGITYAGANNIVDFHNKVEFIKDIRSS